MEPFWHANRVSQVIGRARRAYSHDALPSPERNISVFIYMATFSEDQAVHFASGAHQVDGGKTSDEYVHAVALRKRKVLDELAAVMKRAAVDCALHAPRHKADAARACFRPTAGQPPGALLYSLSLDANVASADDKDKARADGARRLVAVKLHGRLYYKDPATGTLYDHAALKQRNQVKVVRGTLRTASLSASL
jgi:hypothetical protein